MTTHGSKGASKRKAARKARAAHEAKDRSNVTPPGPTPAFRAIPDVLHLTAAEADTESPPVQLIAWALLALVVANASFLMLTARLSREWRV